MPLVETIMIARPTQNSSLYTQMVGRGLRLSPGKEKLTLIDLVGTTGRANLCTAPTLLGMDMQNVPVSKQEGVQGDLFELPDIIEEIADCPESWIKNIEIVNLWAKGQAYNLHNVNWFKMPNGDLVCDLKRKRLIIPAQNELAETKIGNKTIKMQEALDLAYQYLCENYPDQRYIWDTRTIKKWGKEKASEKQKVLIQRFCKNFDTSELTKIEANQILTRKLYRG